MKKLGSPKIQVCVNGHDTFICGRDKQSHCIACRQERDKNPKIQERFRNRQWKRRTITNEDGSLFTTIDYDRNYQIQQGKCKICGKHQSELKEALSVDHNHKTRLFRGLLCNSCNLAIGLLNDSIENIEKILIYLK